MLMLVRQQLLQGDYIECLRRLQSFPPLDDVRLLTDIARKLCHPDDATPAFSRAAQQPQRRGSAATDQNGSSPLRSARLQRRRATAAAQPGKVAQRQSRAEAEAEAPRLRRVLRHVSQTLGDLLVERGPTDDSLLREPALAASVLRRLRLEVDEELAVAAAAVDGAVALADAVANDDDDDPCE
eukprot:COSAG01_NODE_9670_length_2374_cov_1.341978_1_plen_183_part_00